MHICMSGLDHEKAPLEKRERLSFTRSAAGEMAKALTDAGGVLGAVVLSTCNRTEVYLSCQEGTDPGELLCRAAGCEYSDFADAFVTRKGEDCARHLMEVSCGLRSKIIGEDQILTQVKNAAAVSREYGAADPVLETLFRTAASCGKAAKTALKIRGVSGSAAESAVMALEKHFGSLSGMKALVIGNGEMGRLAATLLRDRGCAVAVTLRSYRHAQTIVPAGCMAVPYDSRYDAMEGADIVVSATTSPHYTVTVEKFSKLGNMPRALADLAIPRDIEPGIEGCSALYNIDDLGENPGLDQSAVREAGALVDEYMERFYHWCAYRSAMPAMEQLRRAVYERISPDMTAGEAAGKAIDLLLGEFIDELDGEKILSAAENIRSRTR